MEDPIDQFCSGIRNSFIYSKNAVAKRPKCIYIYGNKRTYMLTPGAWKNLAAK